MDISFNNEINNLQIRIGLGLFYFKLLIYVVIMLCAVARIENKSRGFLNCQSFCIFTNKNISGFSNLRIFL